MIVFYIRRDTRSQQLAIFRALRKIRFSNRLAKTIAHDVMQHARDGWSSGYDLPIEYSLGSNTIRMVTVISKTPMKACANEN